MGWTVGQCAVPSDSTSHIIIPASAGVNPKGGGGGGGGLGGIFLKKGGGGQPLTQGAICIANKKIPPPPGYAPASVLCHDIEVKSPAFQGDTMDSLGLNLGPPTCSILLRLIWYSYIAGNINKLQLSVPISHIHPVHD